MSNTRTKIEQNYLMESLFHDYISLLKQGISPSKAKLLLARKHNYSHGGIIRLINKLSNQKRKSFLKTPDTQKAILVPQGIELTDIYEVLTK